MRDTGEAAPRTSPGHRKPHRPHDLTAVPIRRSSLCDRLPGRLQTGASPRPRSRPYSRIWALPASLPGLLFAPQKQGNITGRGTRGVSGNGLS